MYELVTVVRDRGTYHQVSGFLWNVENGGKRTLQASNEWTCRLNMLFSDDEYYACLDVLRRWAETFARSPVRTTVNGALEAP